MRKLRYGILGGVFVFALFLAIQNNFGQAISKNKQSLQDSIKREISIRQDNEAMQRLGQKVDDMEKYINESQKYIDAGQKNLDLWLKYLAFTLSVLIGYSIFNGLRSRDLAKDELIEIKKIKEEIKKVATETEERLNVVKNKITEIETTAVSAKSIEARMTQQLNEIGLKADMVLTEQQEKIIEESINNAKDDLHKSGLDTFKNLYYAKGLQAYNEKRWEDCVRLWTTYIDLDDTNATAYFQLGTAYGQLARSAQNNKDLLNKGIDNLDKGLSINPKMHGALNNKGSFYKDLNQLDKALDYYSQAIILNPNRTLYLDNRIKLLDKLGRKDEADIDRKVLAEIELTDKKGENS